MGMQRPTNSDQLHGTLDMLVLKVLERPAPWVRHRGATRAHVQGRAQRRGGLALSGVVSNGTARLARLGVGSDRDRRRARFYKLTRAGRAQLEAETASWLRLTTAVADVLKG